MKYLKTFESYNTLYKEIEFVCVNSDSKTATNKTNQENLYKELKNIPDIYPYRQDFSDGKHEEISLAVIILSKENEKELEKQILNLAKKNNVEFDLINYRNDKQVDQIIKGEYYDNILESSEDFKYCFSSGDCDIYAIALHRLYGYPIYVVRGYYTDDDEEYYEDCHVVVKLPNGKFLDYNGENTEQELFSDALFSNNIERIELVEIDEEEAKYIFSSQNQEEDIERVMDIIKLKNINESSKPSNLLNLSKKDINELLNQAEGFNTKEEAKDYLNFLIEKYSNFPNKIKLYRVLFVENKNDIDINNLGIHWTDEKITPEHIERVRDANSDYDEDKIIMIVSGYFDKEEINFYETIQNNLRYPNEKEITTIYGFKPSNIQIKKFKNSKK